MTQRDGADERLCDPVFVSGCERSGTTLLGHMLGAHPDCIFLPEAPFIHDLVHRYAPGDRHPAEELRDFVARDLRFRTWGVPMPPLPVGLQETGVDLPGFVSWFVRACMAREGQADARYWIEHSPLSLPMIARLLDVFPGGRFLNIVRDGRAVAASILPLNFGATDIEAAAEQWTRALAHGLAAERYCGPERAMTLRYEDLIEDPEGTMERLHEFLGLEALASGPITQAGLVPADVKPHSGLIGKPPDKRRINAWKQQLSQRQVEIFEALTLDLLRYHGYELEFPQGARRPSLPERLTNWGLRPLRRVFQRFRFETRKHRAARGGDKVRHSQAWADGKEERT